MSLSMYSASVPVFQKMLREIRQTTSVPAAEHGTCFVNAVFGLNTWS